MAPSEFTLFQKLPAEVRIEIWKRSMPASGPGGPALVHVKDFDRDAPRPTYVDEEDLEQSEAKNPDYRHHDLILPKLKVPMASVNYEAYDIARQMLGRERTSAFDLATSTFTLPFNKSNDAICLVGGQSLTVIFDLLDRSTRVQQARSILHNTKRMAVSEDNLHMYIFGFANPNFQNTDICQKITLSPIVNWDNVASSGSTVRWEFTPLPWALVSDAETNSYRVEDPTQEWKGQHQNIIDEQSQRTRPPPWKKIQPVIAVRV